MSKFQKGQKRPDGAGRKQGSQNKITKTIKEALECVFNDLQSDPKANLLAWAKENPTEFYRLASKLIPTNINASMNEVNKIIVVSPGITKQS